MPIEEALMAFVGIEIPCAEIEKGIPLVSFVVKEGESAVFIKPLPLSAADETIKDRTAAGSEVLYRVDYLQGGHGRFATGTLTTGEKPEKFLELLEQNMASGNEKADIMGIYGYLEAHLSLCGLEEVAIREISFMEKEAVEDPDYREANRAYYQEVLSYVEEGRRCLNSNKTGLFLPVFPQRNVFMVEWYERRRENKRMCRTAQNGKE